MKEAKMNKLILYHGSSEIVQAPVFGKGKSYNDYGRGFYCTEYIELAKEWACMHSAGLGGHGCVFQRPPCGAKRPHVITDFPLLLS